MDGVLIIKLDWREVLINLRNVLCIDKHKHKDGVVELRIDYLESSSDEYYNQDAEQIWKELQKAITKAYSYGYWPQDVIEVNLCGSAEPAAGQVVGGAGGLAEDPGALRCLCGHFLCDHVGGMDCSLCSCELFEYEPDTHRCKCNLVLKDEGGAE